jgi:uncharacterized protein YndB with AHSA1/START domain
MSRCPKEVHLVRIVTTTHIRRPPQQVFEFVTTPANWPLWHPSSVAVRGAVDHSLQAGEQVTEDYVVAGQPGTAIWTVRESSAPHHWLLDGVAANGNRATITYTVQPHDEGTAFERVLALTWLQTALPEPALEELRRQVEAESAEALGRLKVLLEKELP